MILNVVSANFILVSYCPRSVSRPSYRTIYTAGVSEFFLLIYIYLSQMLFAVKYITKNTLHLAGNKRPRLAYRATLATQLESRIFMLHTLQLYTRCTLSAAWRKPSFNPRTTLSNTRTSPTHRPLPLQILQMWHPTRAHCPILDEPVLARGCTSLDGTYTWTFAWFYCCRCCSRSWMGVKIHLGNTTLRKRFQRTRTGVWSRNRRGGRQERFRHRERDHHPSFSLVALVVNWDDVHRVFTFPGRRWSDGIFDPGDPAVHGWFRFLDEHFDGCVVIFEVDFVFAFFVCH